MAKINHSATLNIGGKVDGSWSASVGAIVRGETSIKKEISGLKEEQRGVTAELRRTEAAAARMGIEGSSAVSKLTKEHTRLKGQQAAVQSELKKAQAAAAKLGKAGSADVDRLLDVSEQLEHQERAVVRRLEEARKAAGKLGIDGSADVARLRKETEALTGSLDRQRGRLKNVQAWNKLNVGERTLGAMKQLGSNLYDVGRQAVYAGGALAAVAVGGIAWFTKSAIDATAGMETLETALTTTEGSSAKAKAALDWIQKFAATTPYELDQVGEAYARLRSYGIEPTDGTLRTLGDTAASMGKPLMSSVEAIADAVTGQNERLKEFGIRAETSGNKITYFYKNAAGEDAKKTVKKNSQEMIKATLAAIWNEKYAGSMEKQSHTWTGLVSNLKDQWTQFQVRVMQGGVFDALKGELEGALAQINKWAEDGTLERWAHDIADAYRWAFAKVKEGFGWVRDNWPEIKKSFLEGVEVAKNLGGWLYKAGKWASDAAGGADNLAKGLIILGAAKTLAPLASLASVGWDIVAWLAKASGLSGALSKNMAALKPTMPAGPGGAPGAPAGALTTAAGVAFAGLAGWQIGEGINTLTQEFTGRTASEHLGRWMSSDVDARRAALLNDGRGPSSGVRAAPRSSSAGAGPTIINQTTNHVKVDAASANADEVAEKVHKRLNQSARREALASHHG